MFGKKTDGTVTESRRLSEVRQLAGEAGFGGEVAVYERKPGHPKGAQVVGFYQRGFVLFFASSMCHVVAWSDVTGSREVHDKDGNLKRLWLNVPKSDHPVPFDRKTFDGWPDVDGAEVLRRAQQGVRDGEERQLVKRHARVNDIVLGSDPITYGPITVDSEGIHSFGGALGWEEITRADVSKGAARLLVYTGASQFQPRLRLTTHEVGDIEELRDVVRGMYARHVGRELPSAADSSPLAVGPDLGTITPPTEQEGIVDGILKAADDSDLSGTPRWYVAARGPWHKLHPAMHELTLDPSEGVCALYPDGFVLGYPDEATAYRWEQVGRVRATPARFSPIFNVSRKSDGKSILDNERLPNARNVPNMFRVAHCAFLMDQVVAAFQRDGEFDLGAVVMTKHGFTHKPKDRTIAWSDVESVERLSDVESAPRLKVTVASGKNLVVQDHALTNDLVFQLVASVIEHPAFQRQVGL